MRLLVAVLLMFICGHCNAQLTTLDDCMKKLADDSAYTILAGKLAVGTVAGTTPAMIANTSLPNNQERGIIAAWAAARAECLKTESRYGNSVYRPPLQAFSIDAENKVMAAAVELYDRKITFGEFNRQRQAAAEELRGKSVELSRQIQSQRAAQEQSDWQSRERDQMQRDIDAAERQAAIARQEATQARETASRLSTRPSRTDEARLRQLTPITPLRNCYRFGNRLTCTVW